MPNGNGSKEVKLANHCPFLDKQCIEGECSLYSSLRSVTGQVIGSCSLNAVVLLLSEINQKTTSPQPKFSLPGGFKG